MDGRRIYATNYYDNTVSVIDVLTGARVAEVPVGVRPENVVLAGQRAYVANTGSIDISVLDTRSNAVVGTIELASTPGGLTI